MEDNKVQQYKVDTVAGLQEVFANTRGFIFADFRGLSVAQITDLRSQLRDVGVEFHVVKNNFAKIAFSRLDHEKVSDYFIGPTAIAYCGDETGPAAKILLKLAKDMPVAVKGALVDGEIYNTSGLEALSKLPSKNELIQMLMGTMQAPLRNMVYVFNGVPTKLVRTLDAVREKKSQEG
ncbi:MAG: 50S ribosomal protein L10 [Spirochaeta sp. LUC14_002_19_P3]|nr:MAG: 50S ribosomal protein L10 [Spirochaeta sp. LUC14_002_19_P3]